MILGFDTATEDTSVAIMDADQTRHQVCIGASAADNRPQHAIALLPTIEEAVSSVGGWGEIDRVAVGCGPGSFTGLRIGLATAKGLAMSRDIPAVGTTTLAAIAGAIKERGTDSGPLALALIDARRGEVFAALYGPDGTVKWEPEAIAPAELATRLTGLDAQVVAAGSGAVRFRDEFDIPGIEVPDDADPVHRVSAVHICRLCEGVTAVENQSPEPIYLRAPDAERWRERTNPNTNPG